MSLEGLTPIQKKMLQVLADGMPHDRYQLHACLNDDLGPLSNIQNHITALRKKLRPMGQDILCEIYQSKIHYRQVQLLASACDGKR